MCTATLSKDVKKIFKDEQAIRGSCPCCANDESFSIAYSEKIFREHCEIVYWTLIHCETLLPIFEEDKTKIREINKKFDEIIGYMSDLSIKKTKGD